VLGVRVVQCATDETKLTGWLVRRVKCDEGIPFCYKCISTGRKCDGYGLNADNLPKLETAFAGASAQSPSVGFYGTDDERRSFYFFQQESMAQLSQFFGIDYWEIRLLQAALHEPSIRHAILALGSLHAGIYEKNDSALNIHATRVADDFSLHHYGLAIKTLIDSHSLQDQRTMDICLICCILFACIEVSQSNNQRRFCSSIVDNSMQIWRCYHTRPKRDEDPERSRV